MARGKKKEATLSPEERLEAALVPVEGQPYRVPENWRWVYLTKGFADCLDMHRKPINAAERANRVGDVPYYGATGQVGWIDDYLTDEQLVLLGEDGAPFLELLKDKAYLIEGKAWVNNHAHILRSYWGKVGNSFLVNYLNVFDYKGYVNGTTRLKLTQASMDTIPVPFPPLSEQQRIVDRIESLFAKLDEAKEKAQEALDSFETRRKTMLERAFTGKLTTAWRASKNVAFPWKHDTLINSCEYLRAGGDKPDDFSVSADSQHTVPVVANGVQNEGIIGYSAIEKEKAGAVTVSGRGTIGYSIARSYPFYPVVRLIVARPKNNINPQFLKYHFDAQPVEGTGSSIPQLTVPMIKNREVPVPSIEEQKEIVRILDAFFARESEAKGQVEATLEAIDLMKKSILAKAFRGELGTNDPAEESAESLIKQILSEKITEEKPKRTRTKNQPEVGVVTKTIMQTLSAGSKITPEKLKAETGLDIDDFYDQLKALINSGLVIETRIDSESYLEAKNEDRQPKN